MKRESLLRHLREHGCYLKREGRAHSLWCNPKTGAVEAVPRHTEISIFPTTEAVNDTLRAIAALLANMSQVKSARRRQNNAVREVARKAQTQVGSLAG